MLVASVLALYVATTQVGKTEEKKRKFRNNGPVVGVNPGHEGEQLLDGGAVDAGHVAVQGEIGEVGDGPRVGAVGVVNVHREVAVGEFGLELAHGRLHGGRRRTHQAAGFVVHHHVWEARLDGIGIAEVGDAVLMSLHSMNTTTGGSMRWASACCNQQCGARLVQGQC
jgi:hypothetical protein